MILNFYLQKFAMFKILCLENPRASSLDFFGLSLTYLFQLTIQYLHLAHKSLLSLCRLFLVKRKKREKNDFTLALQN